MSNKPDKSFFDHIREWIWVPIAAPVSIVLVNQYLRSPPTFPSLPLSPTPIAQSSSIEKPTRPPQEDKQADAKPSEPISQEPISQDLLSCQRQNISESTQAIPIQGNQVTANLALNPDSTKIAKIECQVKQPASPLQFELDFGTTDDLGDCANLEISLDGKKVLSRSLGSGVRDRFNQQFNQKFEIQASCNGDKCLSVYLFRLAPLNSF